MMISRKEIFTILSCAPLLVFATNTCAGRVTNERELAILPEYCKGTQGIRDFVKLPKSEVDNYYKVYGEIYHHLHHYCWALVGEYNANRILEKGPRNNELNQALRNIQYVLNKNPPASFTLLPEIYTSRARILFRLGRSGEAVGDLIKAINLQPSYQRAYAQLSDYYLDHGQKDKAISTLEKGVENNLSPTMLLKILERLGKPYKGIPGSAIPQTQESKPASSEKDLSAAIQPSLGEPETVPRVGAKGNEPGNLDSSTASPVQQDSREADPVAPKKPANPYCRFCP